ncbi:Polycomb group RING finger protein 3 [Varanus komodoensis]|nr:Polycomb group RING finger protein 3 [Varanus komodoensis]
MVFRAAQQQVFPGGGGLWMADFEKKCSFKRSHLNVLTTLVFLQTPKMLTRKIKLWDINAHITCRLCSGYLIDATTVTECLHTCEYENNHLLFCRSCLVKYLEENNTCPTCRIVIHQSHPLQYIGHDRTMQDIVYKLVPGLQEGETKADESTNKETSEEKQEEDNDYHRSDEQKALYDFSFCQGQPQLTANAVTELAGMGILLYSLYSK